MPLFDSQRGVDAPWSSEARTPAGVRSQRMPPRFVSHRRAFAGPRRVAGDGVGGELARLRVGAFPRLARGPLEKAALEFWVSEELFGLSEFQCAVNQVRRYILVTHNPQEALIAS